MGRCFQHREKKVTLVVGMLLLHQKIAAWPGSGDVGSSFVLRILALCRVNRYCFSGLRKLLGGDLSVLSSEIHSFLLHCKRPPLH